MMEDLKIKRIFNNNAKNTAFMDLLAQYDLKLDKMIDYTCGIYDEEVLVATGSLYQNIIKCVAIDSKYQGGHVFNLLISHLMTEIYERKFTAIYVYTKYELLQSFELLGFAEIVSLPPTITFMEKTTRGFQNYLETVQAETPEHVRTQKAASIAGIVMNANPFTRGHQFLIEKAASENDYVHVFVLSEDISLFPASVRKELVIKGTAHLPNVFIHDTRDYLVSSKTFPAYFIPDDQDVTRIQAHLDATIFLKIATALNITKRYVGEEPYSVATNIYNEEMVKVYADKLTLIIVPRIAFEENIISATKVRNALEEGDLNFVQQFVPSTTYEFLLTDVGAAIIDKIQKQKK